MVDPLEVNYPTLRTVEDRVSHVATDWASSTDLCCYRIVASLQLALRVWQSPSIECPLSATCESLLDARSLRPYQTRNLARHHVKRRKSLLRAAGAPNAVSITLTRNVLSNVVKHPITVQQQLPTVSARVPGTLVYLCFLFQAFRKQTWTDRFEHQVVQLVPVLLLSCRSERSDLCRKHLALLHHASIHCCYKLLWFAEHVMNSSADDTGQCSWQGCSNLTGPAAAWPLALPAQTSEWTVQNRPGLIPLSPGQGADHDPKHKVLAWQFYNSWMQIQRCHQKVRRVLRTNASTATVGMDKHLQQWWCRGLHNSPQMICWNQSASKIELRSQMK